jgi:hypothetical protein
VTVEREIDPIANLVADGGDALPLVLDHLVGEAPVGSVGDVVFRRVEIEFQRRKAPVDDICCGRRVGCR